MNKKLRGKTNFHCVFELHNCCHVSNFRCPVIEDNGESLKFNSQFESGNLRKAIQVRK